MAMMDAYCERTGPSLLAEPLNTIANASFLLAAWAAWVLAKRTGATTTGVKLLIALGASVGIGSIIWHMYPTSLTLWLDIIPIVVFIIVYIWLYARRVMAVAVRYAVLFAISFVLLVFLAIPYAHVLHGALVYSPGLLTVLVLGLLHAQQQRPERFMLLAAAGVYFVALFFRTIDQEVCASVPIGTHFIWHILIGLVTYLAMRSLILNVPSGAYSDDALASSRRLHSFRNLTQRRTGADW